MRIRNSLQNMVFGLLGQFISLIMGFIVRTVFIRTLGVEYLGVSGLFSDVLMLLSLANLGFETAIIYSLYRPLAHKDTSKIQSFMLLFQKAYRIIGFIILAAGLMLLPFLDRIVHGEVTVPHIEVIYILFLLNSVSTYFFAYKQSIIVADQKQHVISKIHSVFVLITNIVQIILLVSTKNYLIVLTSQIALSVLKNIYISYTADKHYPYLRESTATPLSKDERKDFFKKLRSLMMYKISGVVINGTDNVIIAKMFGIIWVGLYSNYYLILSTINMFMGYIFNSITASVGNMNATETTEKKYSFFRVLRLMNFWAFGVGTVCLWNVLNPLIALWLGEQFVLSKGILLAILLNFYTTGMQNATTTFRDTTGLFQNGKYSPLLAAGLNISFSILLASQIGIAGVFLGTVISRLFTYFWVDPYMLHKHVFKQRLFPHFLNYAGYTLLVLAVSILCEWIFNQIQVAPLLDVSLRTLISFVISNVLFYLIYRNTKEFRYLMDTMRTHIFKRPNKN